jgi:tetratricopeptide (TPR) repeat protein
MTRIPINLGLTLGRSLAMFAFLAPHASATAHLDVVDQLLADGQKKLVQGDAAAALELFQQANGHSSGAPRTELWVLRAHMASGSKNDAMNRGEELGRKGQLSEGEVNYLKGSFSYILAEELVAGGSRNNPGIHYEAAQDYLGRALAAAPDAYLDGWRTLAFAARKASDGEGAEVAVREALKRLPDDPTTHTLGAEILVGNGVAGLASPDEAVATTAKAKVHEGIALADRAVQLLGSDKQNAVALASAHLQRGVAQLWLGDKDAAAEAYAAAMGWDPTQVDFGQLWSSFQDTDQRPVPFVALLTDGQQQFEQRWGKSTSSDATLVWWLAFGEQALGQYEAAEAHFLGAVKKFPAYTNSWWHAGLCRYFRQDYAGAVKHWRENAAVSRENLVASVTADLATNDAILVYVEGKRFGDMTDVVGAADAVFIAELRLQALPTSDSSHKNWNNLGLFCRDTGDMLRRAGKEADEHKTVAEYYDLAYRSYERANELKPGMPYYMNDWAVILHYCLDRDHQKALDLYAQATEVAERMLKQGGLDKDEKTLVEIALRDSKNNRARLVRTLEERKKREAEKGGGGGERD